MNSCFDQKRRAKPKKKYYKDLPVLRNGGGSNSSPRIPLSNVTNLASYSPRIPLSDITNFRSSSNTESARG